MIKVVRGRERGERGDRKAPEMRYSEGRDEVTFTCVKRREGKMYVGRLDDVRREGMGEDEEMGREKVRLYDVRRE